MLLRYAQIFSLAWLMTAVILLQGACHLYSQSMVSGLVKAKDDKPVEFANALLLHHADSSLFRGSIADADGRFTIANIPAGSYFLKVAMTGFVDYYSEGFEFQNETDSRDFGAIELQEDVVLMNAVEVVAKKPLFEQRIDRMVVNVANSITSSGSNALEVLERSPGVLVNHQNNLISLAGKNGVVVMINNRVQYMPPEAVVSMLEGMSADNIERIEIITTPPAGFDAEGNAGYINIVLKSNIGEGFNGSIGANFGVGHGTAGGANLNFNYRKGIANFYGDYTYLRDAQEQVFAFYKRILLNGDMLETDTKSVRDPLRNDHHARLGLDLQITKSTVLGVLASAYDTKWTMDAINTTLISRNEIPDTNILIDNYELNQWKHLGGNANLQHTFAEGKVLSFNADYLWYEDNNPTQYHNQYSDGEFQPLYDNYTRSKKLTPIKVFAAKADYIAGIGKNIKMETGVKLSSSLFTNDVGVDYLQNQNWVPDPELTAKYELDEEILAAYGSLESPLGKGYTMKAGLRYEYTTSELGSQEQQRIVDRQFGEFFPSVFLSKELSEHYTVTASYSKRITRPTFNDMAPFVIFIDPYTFFSGNPALQPSIAHKVGLGFNLKTVVINLDYTNEDSTIARFQSSIIPGTNKQLLFAENLKNTKTIALTLSVPFTPVKWWNMYYNFNFNYQEASRHFEGQDNTYTSGAGAFFSSQTFTISKSLTFEVNAFYSAGGLFGIVKMNSIGSVNAGIQKKFDKTGGTLRVGYDNIFNTMKFVGEVDLPDLNQFFRASLQFGQPTFKISYSQNFGNQSVQGKRERGTGADEERGRIQ